METSDLKKYALGLLDLSKKFLLEDGSLDPTAFIITSDEQILRPLDLQDEVHKAESCAKIVNEAQRKKALAIITIFLARSKDFDKEDFIEESYSWGDIQDTSSQRCIFVTVSGPDINSWAAVLPFRKEHLDIIFQETIEFSKGVDLGLFPGWSDQKTERPPS